jgi:hypothetical protein
MAASGLNFNDARYTSKDGETSLGDGPSVIERLSGSDFSIARWKSP